MELEQLRLGGEFNQSSHWPDNTLTDIQSVLQTYPEKMSISSIPSCFSCSLKLSSPLSERCLLFQTRAHAATQAQKKCTHKQHRQYTRTKHVQNMTESRQTGHEAGRRAERRRRIGRQEGRQKGTNHGFDRHTDRHRTNRTCQGHASGMHAPLAM